MIVSFSISNFRSFSTEETFSLTASKRLSGLHESHTITIPDSDQQVLKAGVVYGANGAGKSNLFKAFRYLKLMALHRREKGKGTGREAFRLGEIQSEPSAFDLQFIVADKLYRYGFKVDDQRVNEEWLTHVTNNHEKILYERVTDADGKVTVNISGLKDADKKLSALATVGGPQNQSFLATVNLTLEKSDYGEELSHVINWFKHGLKLIAPNARFGLLAEYLVNNSNCANFSSSFLKSVSTGVDHLEISRKEISEEDLRSLLPDATVSRALKDVQEDEDGKVVIPLGEASELFIQRTTENHYYRTSIRFAHENLKGDMVPFDLTDESDGTRRLLHLMPALHDLNTADKVYVIDEIDRSLHPNLVRAFLDFFLKSCSNCKSQIILTTHESNLLDLDLLRRDEIWFVEKDQSSATRLYSLTDFKVRTDLAVRKHYLEGRFGAIPFLGDINRLHEIEEPTA